MCGTSCLMLLQAVSLHTGTGSLRSSFGLVAILPRHMLLHGLRHRVPPSRTPVPFLCRRVSTPSLSTVTPCVERSPPPTCTTLPHTSCRSTGGESPSRCLNDDALPCTVRRCCGEGVVLCTERSGVVVLGPLETPEDSAWSVCDTVYAVGVVEGACFLAAARRYKRLIFRGSCFSICSAPLLCRTCTCSVPYTQTKGGRDTCAYKHADTWAHRHTDT
mmetsp:Transcript_18083/g.26480  ORF Transcript_18083/g.26480 Transcript_18083/m.26480 type:complete len:217 (+) Transcript_18083:60-710(+)